MRSRLGLTLIALSSVVLIPMGIAPSSHAADGGKKDIPLSNVQNVLTDLTNQFRENTTGLPMAASSGPTVLYFGPNGATRTTDNGRITNICLPPTEGKSRCWTRDGDRWRGYNDLPTTRFTGTVTESAVDGVDEFINTMEDYGALTTATRLTDANTTTVIVSSKIVHPVTGDGLILERREYVFTPTTVTVNIATDDSVKKTSVNETIKPVTRVAVTAP